MSKRRLIVPVGLAGLCLAVTSLAAADEKQPEKKADTKPAPAAVQSVKHVPPQKSQAAPGMVIVKDSVTGKLRAPTASEAAALAAAAKPATSARQGARTVKGPGGADGLVLDDSTNVYSVATKGPDGKVKIGEVTGPEAAKKAVIQPKTKSAPKSTANNEK